MSRLCKIAIVLLLAWHDAGYAQPALPLLTEYAHTAWTDLDGAPSDVKKFAQGADGWLWIATPTGLYRYDGVRFERQDSVYGHPVDSSNIMAVTSAPDGALWVGYRTGGVSVFRKNGAHTYLEADGLKQVGALHIEVAPDGAIWVAMRDGVAVLMPGSRRFQHLQEDVGLPSLGVFQIMFARNGTTWIGTNTGAYFRKRGDVRFARAWPQITSVWLCEAPDGTIWGNDFKLGYHRVSTVRPPVGQQAVAELNGKFMFFDRQGTMWMIHENSLERKSGLDASDFGEQTLSAQSRISGTMIGTMFQDREGNLWIGTSRGIDRLRPNRLHTMPVAKQLESPALVVGPSGEIWVGDYAGDVWEYGLDGSASRKINGPLTASYTAPDGVVWTGAMEGLQRRDTDGAVSMIALPEELKSLRIHAIQQDRDGFLWVSFPAGKGVYKVVNGRWLKWGGLKGIPDRLVTSMARDDQGDLWMAHVRNEVTVIKGNTVRTFGPQEGVPPGPVLQVYFDGKTIWTGGENGVARYAGGRFISLRGEKNETFQGVSGIVHLPGGDLWLNGSDGLFRIASADVAKWQNDPQTAVAFEQFNAQDGMQGHAPQLRPVPSLRRAHDGMLWYATTDSVGTIDPARFAHNQLAPPVQLVSLFSDGVSRNIPDGRSLALPAGTQSLQIDFTALSLSIPERVRLRYRLIGLDREWQEPLRRRQANYTNIFPGHYRFEVIASNEDKLWNTRGAALDITIPPTFLQSAWFKFLLISIGALLLYIAYALRIRYLTQLMQDRLHERLSERTRIARALHDTLLQSVQALLLSFDAHRRHLKKGTTERIRLDQTLDFAEQLLVEGRDQIMDLRVGLPEALELTLSQFGKGLSEHRAHMFEMKVTGVSQQLRPSVREEVYAIAREALFNASRYAEAGRIELALEYSADAFTMRIRDDGKGLENAVATGGRRPGHWGLDGMRERAACIGATLTLDSKPGVGTEIIVTMPGNLAY